MPIKARQNSVTENESNNDGSMHLIHCTGTGTDGKDCVAWTSILLPNCIPKNFMGSLFSFGFCAALACKTSPTSNNADITSLFCADSNGQYGRRNIRIFRGRGDVDDLDERVVQVASDDTQRCNQCMSSPTLQKNRTVPNICTVCPTWNQFSCYVTDIIERLLKKSLY